MAARVRSDVVCVVGGGAVVMITPRVPDHVGVTMMTMTPMAVAVG
jgi:hypothetical protein